MAPPANDTPSGSPPAEPRATRIARRYAHFHRVLGALLARLGEEVDTFWLGGDGHRITDEPVDNAYAKAVYVVRELTPYQDDLAELAEVQAEAMALIGNAEPTHALLTPKICQAVREARILTNTGFASRARERSAVVARLSGQRDAALAARETFASFGGREGKLQAIERELAVLERALRALRASDAATLREHYRYTRHMCHVHYEDPDAFDQLYVGDVGIILQGRSPHVRRHRPKRRRHRRTPDVEPIATVGPYVFYEERAWREARDRA